MPSTRYTSRNYFTLMMLHNYEGLAITRSFHHTFNLARSILPTTLKNKFEKNHDYFIMLI